jgi:hypothetical protein
MPRREPTQEYLGESRIAALLELNTIECSI